MDIKKGVLLLMILVAFTKVPAQLCQGSLGDPIINITFGAGSNPGPVLTTTKNLSYFSNDCPADGFYTIRNNTNRCFGNTWHTLNNDHTGDPNGYFMLINASLQKSEFYVDTLKGLCPSTTYEFAAWVTNVLLPSACLGNGRTPNLTFNIEKTDGSVLQSYNSGDISSSPTPTWSQYGAFFKTPANVSNVVLRLINNSAGGCGNDLAIDDITFRPCGPQLTPSIKGIAGTTKILCAGENEEVTLECKVSAGYSNPSYQWQESKDSGRSWNNIPGENRTTLIRNFNYLTPAGEFLFRLTVGEGVNSGLALCRVVSSFLTIRINSNPVTSISSNSPACQGSSLNLSVSGGGQGAKYFWSGANSFTATGSSVAITNAQANNSGKYYVEATNSDGCKYTDSTTVTVTPAPVITTSFSSKTICRGESILLGSSGGSSYLWSPTGSLSSATISNPVAKPTDTTLYKVVVSNSSSCRDSAIVTINVKSKPLVNAGPDKVIVEGQSVQLEGSVSGGDTIVSWFPFAFIDNIHSLQPTVNPTVNTNYIITATSSNGCGSSSDTVKVQVYKNVIIPNAFSPNADGINDTWNITALDTYDNYELSVFSRYGQLIFSTKNYNRPWDGMYNGSALPVGTYYYLLDFKVGLPKLSGFVVILR